MYDRHNNEGETSGGNRHEDPEFFKKQQLHRIDSMKMVMSSQITLHSGIQLQMAFETLKTQLLNEVNLSNALCDYAPKDNFLDQLPSSYSKKPLLKQPAQLSFSTSRPLSHSPSYLQHAFLAALPSLPNQRPLLNSPGPSPKILIKPLQAADLF